MYFSVFPYPPINVPPMQVCYDYPPPPSTVSAVRVPHQAHLSKSNFSSSGSWTSSPYQLNPRNQPPLPSLKQRHSTPPRYRSPSDPSYPYTQSWNNWNMYQMAPHNMYTNYNYTPGVVSSIIKYIYFKRNIQLYICPR